MLFLVAMNWMCMWLDSFEFLVINNWLEFHYQVIVRVHMTMIHVVRRCWLAYSDACLHIILAN